MSNSIDNFKEKAENIITNDCFNHLQQEVLLELSNEIYNCLNKLNNN